jgi:Asp-tRNA(Asn)/Glu-tRNA(Gln) amidotransferase A subunit family amidase
LLALKTPVWDKAEELQKTCFTKDVDRLSDAGFDVEWKELDEAFRGAHKCQRTIVLYEASHDAYKFSEAERRLLSDGLRAFLAEGASVAQATHDEMLVRQKGFQRMFQGYIGTFDAVVTPAVPGPAPKGLESTGDPMFSTIWTLLGVPAISIPTGLTADGRPLAIQLIAPAGRDQELLGIAGLCEEVFKFSAAARC